MFATFYLPNFYLQAALRHEPQVALEPIGLIDDQATKAVIIQLNSAAEAAGVHKGMTPSQGLARCLRLIVKTRVRTQEKMLQDFLLQMAGSLAPYVEATAPGICTVQFTDRKSVKSKVERVVAQLEAAGIPAQAGIAPSPDASLLAAHLADDVVEVHNAKDFLAPLPIEALLVA